MTNASRRLQLETQAVRLIRSLLLEVTDDQQTIADTVEGETSIQEAIHAALLDMQEDQILIDGLKENILKLGDRMGRLLMRQEKRTDAIQKAIELAEITKPLQFPEATISLRKVPAGLIVEDEAKIPSHYFEQQPDKLSKSRLKSDLQAGKIIEGASLDNGSQTLSIRRS